MGPGPDFRFYAGEAELPAGSGQASESWHGEQLSVSGLADFRADHLLGIFVAMTGWPISKCSAGILPQGKLLGPEGRVHENPQVSCPPVGGSRRQAVEVEQAVGELKWLDFDSSVKGVYGH